jgi:hypothetical protein
MDVSPVWGLAASEMWISAVAAVISIASIMLYRIYGPQSQRPGPVRSRTSQDAGRAASAP